VAAAASAVIDDGRRNGRAHGSGFAVCALWRARELAEVCGILMAWHWNRHLRTISR
jgi:hypothetical protein